MLGQAAALICRGGFGIFLILCTTASYATSTTLTWQPAWQCGKATKVSKQFVQALWNDGALYSYRINQTKLPIIVAQEPDSTGTILFVRQKNQWRIYPIAKGSSMIGLYSTAAYNRLMIFVSWGNDGNRPQKYLVLNATHQLNSFNCTSLLAPTDLLTAGWTAEYPGLHDFNMDNKGRGTLVSAAYRSKNGKQEKQWYQHTTTDWGKMWQKPSKITKPPTQTPSILSAAKEIPADKTLLTSLLKSLP